MKTVRQRFRSKQRVRLYHPELQRRLIRSRIAIALVIAAILVAGLCLRLYELQVRDHAHFATLSQGNRVRLRPLPPQRGLIYDRHGVLLAENLPSFRLEIVPEDVPDLPQTLDRLSRLIDITPQDRERFERERRRSRPFDAVPLRHRLTDEEVARLAIDRIHFPGVDIRADLTRHYPFGASTAHVIGYMGAVDERDLRNVPEGTYAGLNEAGRSGVERYYESELRGVTGYEQVEVNAQGRTIRVLETHPPVTGQNLYLSLDIRLQRAAEEALAGQRGSIVAIAPESGEILALVSQPSYDANLFIGGISLADYRALSKDPGRPLFNRAVLGQYPPGSTVKPLLGVADLAAGLPLGSGGVYCAGYVKLPNQERRYRDWKRSGHGRTDLRRAIAESCDVYFYQLALELGIDRIHDVLVAFGFGHATGVDLPGERGGLVPSKAWKQRVRKQPWYIGETLVNVIGQGYNLATPLQLAQATATLARRGRVVHPRMVRAREDVASGQYVPMTPVPGSAVPFGTPAQWEAVVDAMHDVVQTPGGTAYGSGRSAPYAYAGKTGTAQVFGLGNEEEYVEANVAAHLRDHALFIGFAPLENPAVAVAVVAEHGGSGGRTAAPIGRQVLDAYLVREEEAIP